jgi:hypothetical protein
MFFSPLRPGDELTTTWLNRARRRIMENRVELGVNSGLCINRNANGTWLRVAKQPPGMKLAITLSGGISACTAPGNSAGDTGTAGSGNVLLVDVTSLSGALVTSNVELVVYNFSTTTGGIDANVLVWIAQDQEGNWFVTAVDCGNP